MNDKPTRKEQQEHIEKIRKLAKRLNDCDQSNYFMPHLTREDYDTIIRALMLHDAVITLDMKKQDGKDVPDTNVGKWIPVSERLPRTEEGGKDKSYWVCTDAGYQCECRWTNDNWGLGRPSKTWTWKTLDIPQYQDVVAWRELPKPYREEENE